MDIKTFKQYIVNDSLYSFREFINELTDNELEERVQEYINYVNKNSQKKINNEYTTISSNFK